MTIRGRRWFTARPVGLSNHTSRKTNSEYLDTELRKELKDEGTKTGKVKDSIWRRIWWSEAHFPSRWEETADEDKDKWKNHSPENVKTQSGNREKTKKENRGV